MRKLHHKRFKVALKNVTRNAGVMGEFVDPTGELTARPKKLINYFGSLNELF